MGRSVTHRAVICYKRLVEGKPTNQVVQETSQSPEGVEYYVQTIRRISLCRNGGMSEGDTARATGHSPYLVREHLDLMERFGLPPSADSRGKEGVQSSEP